MHDARHIQDYSNAASLEPHWGYADRVVPCTNDAGSCAYLDVVYHSHDLGMLYSGILWSAIGGILLVWILGRKVSLRHTRWSKAISVTARRYLLTDFRRTRFLFGRTTRLQVLVLAVVVTYLSIVSFVGIKYATWITPVKAHPGVNNTRSSIGPFADRVGILAYALTPLSILLANRESLLTVITGIPYQHFNFLHRWLGHIILAQSVLHTIGWCIVEIRLYQPQPEVAVGWIKQPYIIWGVVALILLLLLWGLSLAPARRAFGYEFFRKAHYVLAMLYIGACWAHWAQLKCFMLPSLLLWFIDRGVRFFRTGLIHYQILLDGSGMFKSLPAKLTYYDSDVVRLEIDTNQPLDWQIGQHFYLCFSDAGIWQSHPFTPLSLPGQRHSYVLRGKSGETKRIANLNTDTTPVIITGPYGVNILEDLTPETNVLCIAGGTGITFVLPVLLHLAQCPPTSGHIHLVWVVRNERNVEWIEPELEQLRKNERIRITVIPTRTSHPPQEIKPVNTDGDDEITPAGCCCDVVPPYDEGEGSSSTEPKLGLGDKSASSLESEEKGLEEVADLHHRPDVRKLVREFVEGVEAGPTCVYVSGPAGMVSDVRAEVAACNDITRVWKGDHRSDVSLVYDDRLE
ncbi:hypothetical protein CI109_102718 [Kwoniella shandongensis]|uniref:ferric-chelate reductase (NADPH) n=1 Tax=Kwoniella shandongensis TaxID=1734106 RepID=A0A5M6BV70_9TREE|nr:uncharacterized protein CI109_004960 [Kwoniella shandongensis]KAA5526757.1 hypothetical protein CI109_004960 [Kwoniella shandongensis]